MGLEEPVVPPLLTARKFLPVMWVPEREPFRETVLDPSWMVVRMDSRDQSDIMASLVVVGRV